jgi:hypothetical protein
VALDLAGARCGIYESGREKEHAEVRFFARQTSRLGCIIRSARLALYAKAERFPGRRRASVFKGSVGSATRAIR